MTPVAAPANDELGLEYQRSDKPTVHGMHDGLESSVGTKLIGDVVEMVSERLEGNPKSSCDFRRILSVGEPAEYALFLFREARNGNQMSRTVSITVSIAVST
jgi:hypothetical protein